ncbi:hypothetical protein B5X24_HaOG213048 [Helicoverpa armigera]|nr:hypothetical protein B5X24_HaOG213048 [Helicoverpa armigera]
MCLITLISTLLFLYGIAQTKPTTYLIFMYTTVMLILFNMVTSCLMLFVVTKECTRPYLFGGANFAGALFLVYFLVVVNSFYRDEMTANTNNTGSSHNNNANSSKNSKNDSDNDSKNDSDSKRHYNTPNNSNISDSDNKPDSHNYDSDRNKPSDQKTDKTDIINDKYI